MTTELTRFVFRLLVFGIAVLVVRDVAFGQGASGEVPDPMGLREVNELLDRHLDLDASERLMVEAIHDEYLSDFAKIRDTQIAVFLADGRAMAAANTGIMPSLEVLEAYVDSWRAAVSLVHQVDARLFTSMSASMGDDAIDGIERARLVRRRRASTSTVMGPDSLRDAALDDAFWSILPTEEEVSAVDDILRGLETTTPRLVELLAEQTVEAILTVATHLHDAGYENLTEQDMMDGDRSAAIMEEITQAYATAMIGIFESRDQLADREVAAARLLRDRLEPARWALVKRRWAASAFPEAAVTSGRGTPEVPQIAEKVRDLLASNSENRGVVEEILLAWYRSDDRITDRMIESGREVARMMFENMVAMNSVPREDSISTLVESRKALRVRTVASLLALLPEDARLKMLADVAGQQDGEESDSERKEVANFDGATEAEIAFEISGRSTSKIVNPIALGELELILDILTIEAAERDVARSLHADYLDDWTQEVAPILERAAARPVDEDDDAFGVEALAQNDDYLTAVLTTRALDDRLFGDFAAVFALSIPEDGLEAVRLQRVFDQFVDPDPLSIASVFDAGAPEVSPFEIIESMNFDPAIRAAAEAALVPATPELLAMYAGFDTRRIELVRKGIADSMAYHEGDLDYEAMTSAMNGRAIRFLVDAERRRVKVASSILDAVVPAVDRRSSLELRLELLDRALPIRGGTRGLEMVRRVLRMSNLRPEQVEIIDTILREHLEQERALVDRAQRLRLESSRAPEVAAIEGGVVSTYGAEQAFHQEIGKITFRRDELRERLRTRVLATLSPAQRAEITGVKRSNPSRN